MKRFAMLTFAVCATASYAAELWREEPASFLGFAIGSELVGTGLSACTWKQLQERRRLTSPCTYQSPQDQPNTALVFGAPDLGFPTEVSLDLVDNKLARIRVGFDHHNFGRTTAMLTERYGDAHQETTRTVSNAAGATFDSSTLIWRGAAVSIIAIERSGTINRGTVAAYSTSLMTQKMNTEESVQRSKAGKF